MGAGECHAWLPVELPPAVHRSCSTRVVRGLTQHGLCELLFELVGVVEAMVVFSIAADHINPVPGDT